MPTSIFATKDEKAELAAQALSTPQGRMHVAQQMLEPIKFERDYLALGRQGFVIDQLEQGELPYYDKDVKIPAVTLSKRGAVPQIKREGNRVFADIFPIATYPLVPIEDTKLRRFNILDRVQMKARSDMAEAEDILIFGNLDHDGNAVVSSLETAATTTASLTPYTGGNPVHESVEGVTRDSLAVVYGEIMKRNMIPEAVLLNPRQYVDIFMWGRDELDPETQREVKETGRVGTLWGMDLHVSHKVPCDQSTSAGTVYMRAGGQYLGVISVLIDLDIWDAPSQAELAYGFLFFEFIGITVINVGGVAKLSVTYPGSS